MNPVKLLKYLNATIKVDTEINRVAYWFREVKKSEDITTLKNIYNKNTINGTVCFEIPILKYIKIKYNTQKPPNKYETNPCLTNKYPERISNRKYNGINRINSLIDGSFWEKLKFIFCFFPFQHYLSI